MCVSKYCLQCCDLDCAVVLTDCCLRRLSSDHILQNMYCSCSALKNSFLF